jgi:putative ABC transport system permease protein
LAIGVSVASGVVAVLEASRGHGTPFRNIDRAVALYRNDAEMQGGRFYFLSVGALSRVANESRTIASLGTWEANQVSVRTDNAATLAYSAAVSAAVPRILGVRAALGRTFVDGDEQPGAPEITVLSYAYWRTRFSADSSVVGRTISVDGRQHLVVGVMEPRAEIPSRVELWTLRPLRQTLADTSANPSAIALLAPGSSASAATAELSSLGAFGSAPNRRAKQAHTLGVAAFSEYLGNDAKGTLQLLSMIGIVVGLIAATNFAALILARGIRRRGELAIRASLGATTSRLVAFMVTECVLISVAGGLVGGLFAPLLVQMIAAGASGLLPPWMQLSFSVPVVAAAVGLSLLVGVVFGLAPALELARPAALGVIRGGQFATVRQRSGRRLLVAVQVALATGPIVFVAALFGGVLRIGTPTPGFNQSNLYVGTVGASQTDSSWRSPSARASLVESVRQAPGVAGVAVSSQRYLASADVRATTTGSQSTTSGHGFVWNQVTPQFFATYKPTLVAGRLPSEDELAAGAPIAVVTEQALRALKREQPTGWRLQLRGDVSVTVIGVVNDIRQPGFVGVPTPVAYTALARGERLSGWSEAVWIRAAPGMNRIVASVFDALRYNSAGVQIVDLQSSTQKSLIANRDLRSLISLVSLVFAVALLLASIGIYGTIAYSSVMRRKEVAVRLALGGSKMHVAGVVMKEASAAAALGLLIGNVCGQLATAVIPDATTPISMPPLDAMLLTSIAFALVLLIASVAPVRRVWSMDYSSTLREDA